MADLKSIADALAAAGISSCTDEDLALLPDAAPQVILDAIPHLTATGRAHLALSLDRIAKIGEGKGGARRRKAYEVADPGPFRSRLLVAPGNAATFASALESAVEGSTVVVARTAAERDELLDIALVELRYSVMRPHFEGRAKGTAGLDWTFLQPALLDRARAMLIILLVGVEMVPRISNGVIEVRPRILARSVPQIEDTKLVSLVAGALDRAPEVVRLIRERATLDPDALAPALVSSSRALSDGAL